MSCRSAIRAAGALLQYVRDTQKSALPHIRALHVEERGDALLLDAASRRNLELDASLTGNADATLLAVLDSCVTAMGSRQLRRWLNRPLTQPRAAARSATTPLGALIDGRRFAAAARARCRASAISSASWRASRCARRGRATSRSCAARSRRCRRYAQRSRALDSPLLRQLRERMVRTHADVHALLERRHRRRARRRWCARAT